MDVIGKRIGPTGREPVLAGSGQGGCNGDPGWAGEIGKRPRLGAAEVGGWDDDNAAWVFIYRYRKCQAVFQ